MSSRNNNNKIISVSVNDPLAFHNIIQIDIVRKKQTEIRNKRIPVSHH